MNVNLGTPYEAIIARLIEKGYAGNQTELIRQALSAYEREIEEEEVMLVNKGIQHETQLIHSGKTKTVSFSSIKKKHKA